jgi:2-oxo-3-hexenedioate decarboxylase
MTATKSDWSEESASEAIWAAEQTATPRTSICAEWPEMDEPTAYRIQDALLDRRIARGERLVGIKLGLTSRAKQISMGINSPTVSWLTDQMALPAGDIVPFEKLIHPRAEPEIAFQLGSDLSGPGVTAAAAMQSVACVMGAIELIDSRFHGFKFKLPDTIADNSSSGAFVLGPLRVPVDGLDLAMEAVLVECDGVVVDSATGAAVLGSPAEALAWAANKLAARNRSLKKGWVVLTGGMTDAIPVSPGSRITARFSNLSTVTVSGGGPHGASKN